MTLTIRSTAVLLLVAFLGQSPWAQEPFTPEIARKTIALATPQVSPDGKTVVVVHSKPNFTDNKTESELYAIDTQGGAVRPLTYQRRTVSMPRWSPDGKTLAFLAPDLNTKTQVWLMPMHGGDTRCLTKSPTGVKHFAWRPDGLAIAYVAEDEPAKLEGEAKHVAAVNIGAQDLFLRSELMPQHIWLKDLSDGDAKRLTSGSWSLKFQLPPGGATSLLSWSPDGAHIAFARVPTVETGRGDEVSIQILEAASGTIKPLNDLTHFQSNPLFSPDGRSVAFAYPREGRADLGWQREIHLVDRNGGSARSVTRSLDRNIAQASWIPGTSELLVAANDADTIGLWTVSSEGAPHRIDLGDLVPAGGEFAFSAAGAFAFIATTADRPAEVYILDSSTAKPRRLTSFNSWSEGIAFGRAERVTWKTSDGFDADGILVLPHSFSAASMSPLVLLIHGGPTASSNKGFSALAQLMAAEGWAVFMPNYRGSDNLGNAYTAAIVGDMGRGPGRDVMEGIAEVAKRKGIDVSRKAVTGWSYGGFMTTWLLGNYPDEWKAGMAGAPVTNWFDQYNFSDGNVMIARRFGGSPWSEEAAARYREQSPATYARAIKAPTLIMSNLEDYRVPPTQAMALYRALKDKGVTTEFVGFPGRTHSSTDPINTRERTRLWIDWVKRHIGATTVTSP